MAGKKGFSYHAKGLTLIKLYDCRSLHVVLGSSEPVTSSTCNKFPLSGADDNLKQYKNYKAGHLPKCLAKKERIILTIM